MRMSISGLIYETKLYHVPLAFQCICGCNDERNGNREDRSEISGKEGRGGGDRLPGLLYANDLVSYDKSKEDLNVVLGHFVVQSK